LATLLAASRAAPVQAQTAGRQLAAETSARETVDAATALSDLLPVPAPLRTGRAFFSSQPLTLVPGIRNATFFQVPEVHFQNPALLEPKTEIVKRIAKIKRINETKPDHFIELLQSRREDLAGLPFQKGESRRLAKEEAQEFARQVRLVRMVLPGNRTDQFLARLDAAHRAELDRLSIRERPTEQAVTRARLAAFMQMLVIEDPTIQAALVNYLGGVKTAEATRALTRLAIFPFEQETRQAALGALQKRDTKAVTDMLLSALRYPWPAVADNAAGAIVALKRTDLIPKLVDFLDEPDPLAPTPGRDASGRPVTVVRELVRVNHHRNCLLCHAPVVEREGLPGLLAPIPSPLEPLPEATVSYFMPTASGPAIRADVTYLRQDFTLMLPVEKHGPWPDEERFDFFVRSRALSAAEAKQEAEHRHPGYVSPAHRAASRALRELTGRQSEPTAAAWRRTLGLDRAGKKPGR
jgi:hypothetical protein